MKISVRLLGAFLASTLWADPSMAQSMKPNIVVFMTDDMGIGDTSAYLGIRLAPGAKAIPKTLKTPSLEKLAKQGMIFTDAHAPASMCSSTR